jgi:hypothetical protein
MDDFPELLSCLNGLLSWLGETIWRMPEMIDFFDQKGSLEIVRTPLLPLVVQESFQKVCPFHSHLVPL